MSTERRSEKRRKSRVNKLVRAEIQTGQENFQTFLYLVDISHGGMRAHLDRKLEVGSEIRVAIPLDPYLAGAGDLEARCRVVWGRELLGGTQVNGFEFLELDQQAENLVDELFEAFTPEGKRKRFRLNQILNVAFQREGTWVPRMACDLSPEGLGLQMAEPLPVDAAYPFLLYLEDQEKYGPVEVQGRVTYVAEFDDGVFRAGIEFQEISDEAALRIQNYIDKSA